MDKLARPLGLIDYDSVNATNAKKNKLPYHKKIFHFKTILFATIFSIVASALLYSLLHKEKMKFSIIRDRTALFVILPNGSIRNEYILRITNKTAINKKLHISSSLPEMLLKTQGFNEYNEAIEVELPADNEVELTLFAIMPSKTSMQNEIEYNFVLKDEVNNSIISRQTSFIAGNK
jgi:polyferredoxin